MRHVAPVGWREVWDAVRASAVTRLGKLLLLAYLLLAVVGLIAVAVTWLVMRL
jgi:hypothetical protein